MENKARANDKAGIIILLIGVAAVAAAIIAADLFYFSAIEKKYELGGPELLFPSAGVPASAGLSAIKENLLKNDNYAGLQKFGDWPVDLSKLKFLGKNPFTDK
jgi:hypothetical protein